jgi:hypothetical protein
MEIEQRALWVARAGAAVAGYALVEVVLGLFWDHVALISPLLAMVTWVVCWFSVADRDKSWGNFRVITEMLRSVPLWASALWALSLLSVFVTFFAAASHAAFSLLGFYFGLSSSLVAWGRWRCLTGHQDLR